MELPGAIELKDADEFVVDRLPEDSSVFDATEKPSALYVKMMKKSNSAVKSFNVRSTHPHRLSRRNRRRQPGLRVSLCYTYNFNVRHHQTKMNVIWLHRCHGLEICWRR